MTIQTNRKVIDISHWQTISNLQTVLTQGDVYGIIHKSTSGESRGTTPTWFDDKYANRKIGFVQECLCNDGKPPLWAAYHWLTNNYSAKAQLDWHLQFTGVHDDMEYALDWETDNNYGTAGLEKARQYLELLEQETGRKGILYSGNVAKEALGNTVDPFFGAHRLWLAQYTTNPSWQRSWQRFWIWQHTGDGQGPEPRTCPAIDSWTDCNTWEHSVEELRAQWRSAAAPPPPVDTPVVNITIQAPPGVIVNVTKT